MITLPNKKINSKENLISHNLICEYNNVIIHHAYKTTIVKFELLEEKTGIYALDLSGLISR